MRYGVVLSASGEGPVGDVGAWIQLVRLTDCVCRAESLLASRLTNEIRLVNPGGFAFC
jgi:hypothetical protein